MGRSFHEVGHISFVSSLLNVTKLEVQVTLDDFFLCLVGTINKQGQKLYYESRYWCFEQIHIWSTSYLTLVTYDPNWIKKELIKSNL